MNSNYRKNLKDLATACKNYVDETKEQILWQVGQYNITTQDDNTTAYQKVVPTGATRAKIKYIGFISYKSENLLNESNFNTSATNLHSLTNGVLTSTGIDSRSFTDYSKSDFKLYLSAGTYQIKLFDRTITQENLQNLVVVKESGSILTSNNTIYSSESGNFQFTINDAGNYGIILKFIGNIKPMLISGSTAPTEYKQGFENIRDSIVTKVYSRKAALKDLRFTQIGAYTFTGNETLTEYTRSNDNKKTYACAINGRATTTDVFFENLSLSTATTMNNMEDNSYRGATDTTSVIFYSTSYQTSASMLTFLTGKTIYYKLATELETPQQAVVDYFVIDTITIPDEVKALDGYGRGINENCYNVLDFNTKEFTDKDDEKDLGSSNWNYVSVGSQTPSFNTPRPSNSVPNSLNLLCELYEAENSFWNTQNNWYKMSIGNSNINISNPNYTSGSDFKTAMSGIPLRYERNTYDTTNVSQYIPNNVIKVEAGGYLVFENQYGQAVPSNITYRIEVAS